MLAVSDVEVYTLWWIAVAVAFVVVIVAAGLLTNILVIARNISGNVSTILGAGAKILDNTTRLRLLVSVYGAVVPIRTTALHINEVTAAIAGHGKVCRHCPTCVSPQQKATPSLGTWSR
ncbi:MAG: hypothetical protein QOE72_1814 [Chloroflexota bacterium]|jgi:hypothetical protein|nr:hypothetical protein [Chloroflexota bacterium]